MEVDVDAFIPPVPCHLTACHLPVREDWRWLLNDGGDGRLKIKWSMSLILFFNFSDSEGELPSLQCCLIAPLGECFWSLSGSKSASA